MLGVGEALGAAARATRRLVGDGSGAGSRRPVGDGGGAGVWEAPWGWRRRASGRPLGAATVHAVGSPWGRQQRGRWGAPGGGKGAGGGEPLGAATSARVWAKEMAAGEGDERAGVDRVWEFGGDFYLSQGGTHKSGARSSGPRRASKGSVFA